MSDCLFCKIIDREIPCNQVYEDEELLAFYDINPMASTHLLIIPKQHYRCLNEIPEESMQITSKMLQTARQLAKQLKLEGYRVIMNTEAAGGQTVFHLHLHLLAGQLGPNLAG